MMRLILSLGLLAGSMPMAQAQTCFEPSPNVAALGEAYYDVSGALPVSKSDPNLAFLSDLADDWHGELVERECTGSDTNPTEEWRRAEVEATIKPNDSALFVIDLAKTYRHRIISGETVFLLDNSSVFDINSRPAGVQATERLRRGVLNRGTQLVEIMSDIQLLNPNQLHVDWHLYSNGVFVYSQSLRLRRH